MHIKILLQLFPKNDSKPINKKNIVLENTPLSVVYQILPVSTFLKNNLTMKKEKETFLLAPNFQKKHFNYH